jgi:hypothetical protein
MTETTSIRCWHVGGTPDAMLISTTPKNSNRNGKKIWIPKSQVEHITRQPEKVNEWQEIVITIPEWLAEKKDLL